LKSCLVFVVWLWSLILSLQIFPLLVNITDLYTGIRTKNYENVWFDCIYIITVIAYGCKLIFHDKIFNTFIFDAKSVEGFTNKLIETIYLTILTILCLILVIRKNKKFVDEELKTKSTTTPNTTTTTTLTTTPTTTTTTTTTLTTTPTTTTTTTTTTTKKPPIQHIFNKT
jgi:hypothetical protein